MYAIESTLADESGTKLDNSLPGSGITQVNVSMSPSQEPWSVQRQSDPRLYIQARLYTLERAGELGGMGVSWVELAIGPQIAGEDEDVTYLPALQVIC